MQRSPSRDSIEKPSFTNEPGSHVSEADLRNDSDINSGKYFIMKKKINYHFAKDDEKDEVENVN